MPTGRRHRPGGTLGVNVIFSKAPIPAPPPSAPKQVPAPRNSHSTPEKPVPLWPPGHRSLPAARAPPGSGARAAAPAVGNRGGRATTAQRLCGGVAMKAPAPTRRDRPKLVINWTSFGATSEASRWNAQNTRISVPDGIYRRGRRRDAWNLKGMTNSQRRRRSQIY